MNEYPISVRVEVKEPNVFSLIEKVIRTADGFEIQPPSDTSPPDILIVEVGEDIDQEFITIQALIESKSVEEVFLVSENTGPEVLLKAIKAGVKEFFSRPLDEGEIQDALEKSKRRIRHLGKKEFRKTGKIINVIGSKGGVGTTSVAVNLAASLARKPSKPMVVLVDLNMLYGEVPLFLSFKPDYDWNTLSKNISRMDATYLMNILSNQSYGVHVLPAPNNLSGYHNPTPETIGQILEFMKNLFDFIVIDGGQSLNDISLKAMEISDIALLISILSLPCLTNTNKLYRTYTDLGYLSADRIRIVINRYLRNSDISVKDAEDSLNKRIFWTVPNDYRTSMTAINQGKPLHEVASKAPITRSIANMADELSKEEDTFFKKAKKPWWRFSN